MPVCFPDCSEAVAVPTAAKPGDVVECVGRPTCSRLLFHKEETLCYDVDRKVASWAS
jgi:hypothetical protein